MKIVMVTRDNVYGITEIHIECIKTRLTFGIYKSIYLVSS